MDIEVRRKFLTGLGASAVPLLAGCTGGMLSEDAQTGDGSGEFNVGVIYAIGGSVITRSTTA